ncbi:MAG: YXWGXW repeat-containing protein [Magnetococcus sp. WYHC-3]
MKTSRATLLVMTLGLSLTGCVSPQGEPDNTGTGALIGGATGAIIGASVARHPGVGAAIGGAAGVIAGGLIGHSIDNTQKARLQNSAPRTWQNVEQGQPLSIADVKALANAGVSDELIISQINNTRTVYRLGTADIIALKNAGVSEKVINFMINTPTSALTPPSAMVVASEPPPAIRETVVVASPGPGYVWISGAWVWHGSGWGWCAGHWAMPPHPRAHWVAGGWESDHGRRMWRPGHWR